MLYIPDQEAVVHSSPKPAPPPVSVSPSQQPPSSVESEGTVLSSSISQPLPDSSPLLHHGQGSSQLLPDSSPLIHRHGSSEEMFQGDSGPGSGEDELFEEVTDSHMVLISRYISDDQVSG